MGVKTGEYALNPDLVLKSSGTDDAMDFVRLGINAARAEDYDRGLIFLAEAYKRLSDKENVKDGKVPPSALSYYGLCLAQKKGGSKEAAEFCQIALQMEFYNPDHYMNLARVYVAAGARRKALETLDRGLSVEPRNGALQRLRIALGVRKTPVIPFLHRDNPLNITLGRLRHRNKKKKKAKA